MLDNVFVCKRILFWRNIEIAPLLCQSSNSKLFSLSRAISSLCCRYWPKITVIEHKQSPLPRTHNGERTDKWKNWSRFQAIPLDSAVSWHYWESIGDFGGAKWEFGTFAPNLGGAVFGDDNYDDKHDNKLTWSIGHSTKLTRICSWIFSQTRKSETNNLSRYGLLFWVASFYSKAQRRAPYTYRLPISSRTRKLLSSANYYSTTTPTGSLASRLPGAPLNPTC